MSVNAVDQTTGNTTPLAGNTNNLVGNLSALTTSVKSDAVGAINEVNANKQNATDNSLQTTDKTVVGAVNELKSGLTNVADDVKLNTNDLTTPSRTKNLLPMTLNGIKSANTTGTWSGNAYTVNGVTFTVQTDSDGNVAGININGTTTGGATFNIANNVSIPLNGTYKFMGNSDFSTGTAANTFVFGNISEISTYNNAKTETISDNFTHAHIYLWSNKTFNNVMVYPMFMLDSESSDDFAPYIPSVESRIEAVESGLTGLNARFVSATLFYNAERNVFPAEIPPTDAKQICLIGRLIMTGALIVLWYDASSQGFRIGKVLDGSNPSDGQGLHVQYFA